MSAPRDGVSAIQPTERKINGEITTFPAKKTVWGGNCAGNKLLHLGEEVIFSGLGRVNDLGLPLVQG